MKLGMRIISSDRIYLSPPSMTGDEMKYIKDAFEKNWIAPLGENVDEFEKGICRYVHSDYALAVNAGTAAIFLALKALGVGSGDTVFCSDLTFAGSCFPIRYLGAKPVFIDCDPQDGNMSAVALQKAFEKATGVGDLPKAIIIVDLYGNPADYDRLLPICSSYHVPVIEDAAEALGSVYRGRFCGTFGEIGIFSFNGNKIITTSGGGMAVSRNESYISKMRYWATQAREPVTHYEHREIGYNLRLSNICASIGRGQFEHIEQKISRRMAISGYYRQNLKETGVRFLSADRDTRPNCWLNAVILGGKNGGQAQRVITELERLGIEARPLWKPMHEQPVFEDAGFVALNDSTSSSLYKNGLCLPSGDQLTTEQQDMIIEVIRRAV